jgi:hypothetical protein
MRRQVFWSPTEWRNGWRAERARFLTMQHHARVILFCLAFHCSSNHEDCLHFRITTPPMNWFPIAPHCLQLGYPSSPSHIPVSALGLFWRFIFSTFNIWRPKCDPPSLVGEWIFLSLMVQPRNSAFWVCKGISNENQTT